MQGILIRVAVVLSMILFQVSLNYNTLGAILISLVSGYLVLELGEYLDKYVYSFIKQYTISVNDTWRNRVDITLSSIVIVLWMCLSCLVMELVYIAIQDTSFNYGLWFSLIVAISTMSVIAFLSNALKILSNYRD
jgi:hypothetical protein